MKELSLYVHIPFCKSKCLYCDFPSFANRENLMSDYINALIKEINMKATKYIIRSLFIGGGTPSYLSEGDLEKLLKCLDKLNFKENAEKTIECNPGTISDNKLKIIKKYNINRISIGLQSVDNNILKSIGRIHTFEQFKENYQKIRKYGFNNVNIDVMFGLPNQSVKNYINGLKEIINLKPEHISAYSLIIEEGTPFFKDYENEKLNLPNEDQEREMYHKGKELLELNGYNQYEISNFAKDNKRCFHNIQYWKCNEYLGVGAYSSSFIDSKRIKNVQDIKEYIHLIDNNKSTEIIENINNLNDNMEEFMFMGLRMIEGIEKLEFERRFKKNIYSIYNSQINNNIKKGLLLDKDERIKLTPLGIEFSNEVMCEFIF
ncbi:radical SAM family heme chaperone HemW [Clostridium sp. HCP1S3_B4]|uniref:radical SAM family heme chaperone HemW n=1 Tax=unclassified Clostridium TaxID=2614128 RepID=UPI003F89D5D7